MSQFYVYILTNKNNSVIYVGYTNELKKRIYLHRHRLIPGFTKRYNVTKLVYFELCCGKSAALKREYQLKAGSRTKKIKLIESTAKPWEDMFDQIQ